ncbi:hypothetical protein BH09ACT10_BH09ACT10_03870 [soil metagenome]
MNTGRPVELPSRDAIDLIVEVFKMLAEEPDSGFCGA